MALIKPGKGKGRTVVVVQQGWGGSRGWHGGKGNGKGGGQWVFLPGPQMGGGKGIGKDPKKAQWNKTMDKLQKIAADQKVWVGGLAKDVTWKKLEKHFEENGAAKPKITEIMRKGTGVCAFSDAADAAAAIATINGTELEGKVLEVDVWTEKEKKEGEKPKRKLATFKGKTTAVKGKSKTQEADPSMKVWVGGLAEKTSGPKLKKHFVDNGCEAEFAEVLGKKGNGCVTFKSEADATSAIASMNGTELDGKAIEVDVWTKSEKKEKKVKTEE